jgi:hypothetical protein
MPLTGLLGRNGVSPVLRQNIDDLPFLINGTPQVLELTVDCQLHLTQMPGISKWPAAPTQSCGICASQLVAPLAHGFEAHCEAAFSHSELDIAITQAEANIQTNTLVDHVHGEPTG